jgi:hemolysin III
MPNTPHPSDIQDIALPFIDEAADSGHIPEKPTWRGWIHTGTFPLAIVLGVVLVAVANGTTARVGAAVFAGASLLLFGISALYHRINWSPEVKALFRRLDHANIFLLIAGTYTPITLLSLPREKAAMLLGAIWSMAALGIVFRVFWLAAPRWLYVPIYVVMGWAAVVFIGDFFRANWITMTLVLAGGILYSLGALVYGIKRPNPFPRTFGFHEVFHTLTALAFLCHWTGVLLVAVDPPLG